MKEILPPGRNTGTYHDTDFTSYWGTRPDCTADLLLYDAGQGATEPGTERGVDWVWDSHVRAPQGRARAGGDWVVVDGNLGKPG